MMLDVVFGPNDESWLKLLLSLPLMIALLAAPAFGICLGRDIWLEKNLPRLAVSGRTLEIWEPRPDFDLCGGPRRVEVVSGTSEVWNIEWDDEEDFGEEDEEDDDAPDAPS